MPINPGQAGSGYNSSDAWDYFHINSVDKDRAGNYLVSARDACAVHKINGTDGRIIWRLGGKRSSFTLTKEAQFCFQHHARFLPRPDAAADAAADPDVELISLYDNSAHGSERGGGSEVHTAPRSSGKILRLDTARWTAELARGFYPPAGTSFLSKSQGSTQILPGGNALVNWGSEGAVTEYLPAGEAVFHAYMDSGALLGAGVENYRAFRYNWTGLPSEEPAVVALKSSGGGTAIYVSWNGDTETRVWRFYDVDEGSGSRRFLGEAARVSFETALMVPREVHHVSAEAVDRDGNVLRTSRSVAAEPEINPFKEVVASDDRDGQAVQKLSSVPEAQAPLKRRGNPRRHD